MSRFQRKIFYYGVVVWFIFAYGAMVSGQLWQLIFWSLFVSVIGWQAFATPSSRKRELQNFVGSARQKCGRCEYDLTGNTTGICSECGWGIPGEDERVETFAWAGWWKHWEIEYLDRPRRKLAGIFIGMVLAVAYGLVPFFADRLRLPKDILAIIKPSATIIGGLIAVNLLINGYRIWKYMKRDNTGKLGR